MAEKKYIVIPEYKPLYAMKYCYGPTHGPLTEPCPTPIEVIGKLLLQSGNEKLSIYEVKFDPIKRVRLSEPIKLTLTNYKLPYDEIVAGKAIDIKPKETVVIDTKEASESVAPVKEEETLVETKNIEEIPEVKPDEIDEKMIQEAEEEPTETTISSNVVVTTATSADGTVTSSSSVIDVPETPVEAPFVTGTVVGEVEEPIDNVTTSSEDTYMVPVTTAEGTKMIDTGMIEAEYKALSKSERRRLRKTLANESEEYISDYE